METEGIVVAIKKLILPELEAIKGIQAKMDVKLDAVEKRISDLQVHLVEQSRRREEAVTGDILTRLRSLETKTA